MDYKLLALTLAANPEYWEQEILVGPMPSDEYIKAAQKELEAYKATLK